MAMRIVFCVLLLAIVCLAGCGRNDFCRIEVGQMPGNRLLVTLENHIFLARYAVGRGGRKGNEWAIRDLVNSI